MRAFIYMKVRFLTGVAGIRFAHNPNDIVEIVDDRLAQQFIKSGAAERVDETPKQTRKRTMKQTTSGGTREARGNGKL